MKNVLLGICSLLILINIFFYSCKKETIDERIISPNGSVVSSSMQELTKKIAPKISDDPNDVEIIGINYLGVKTGYVAEIKVNYKSSQSISNVYLVSNENISKFRAKDMASSLITGEDGVSDRFIAAELTFWCSCEKGGRSDQACGASSTYNPKTETITGECKTQCNGKGCYQNYGNLGGN